MDKKAKSAWLRAVGAAFLIACIGPGSVLAAAPAEILPVLAEVTSVERLNDIAAKPPYQKTDTLVFRVNFKLSNPNGVLARVEDFHFEVKVEDGTPEKTIVLAGSMPNCVILSQQEMMWSWTEPYIYGGVLGSYILRGMGGAEGVKGAVQKLEELWKDLGADKRTFFIEGDIASSLPDFPDLGIVHHRFNAEFAVPKL
jgi:hypothetical protein